MLPLLRCYVMRKGGLFFCTQWMMGIKWQWKLTPSASLCTFLGLTQENESMLCERESELAFSTDSTAVDSTWMLFPRWADSWVMDPVNSHFFFNHHHFSAVFFFFMNSSIMNPVIYDSGTLILREWLLKPKWTGICVIVVCFALLVDIVLLTILREQRSNQPTASHDKQIR